MGILDPFSANLIIEPIASLGAPGAQEQATYVVNPDALPAAQLAVDIPISQ